MNRIIGIAVFLMLATVSADAASVRLKWDKSPDPRVTGYRVKWGRVPGTYTSVEQVGNVNTYRARGLVSKQKNYFVCVSINAAGVESVPGNQIAYAAP